MIYEIISRYHELSKMDKHHRFKSWEHCYNFFSSNYKGIQDERSLDHGCLNLAFYLASWGMLRGGAFLLQKDYRIHEYFLKEVVSKQEYHKYFDPFFQTDLNECHVNGIDALIKDTNNVYINNITQINGEEKQVSLTDTLTSKILLGVFGNVPAYDRYLKAALKLHGMKQQFNEGSLLEIVDFFKEHKEEFQKCQQLFKDDGTIYTPMKLIDMYFWQVGFLMDTHDESSSELEKIHGFAAIYAKQRNGNNTETYRIRNNSKPVQTTGLTNEIRKFLIELLNQAKEDGLSSIDLKSGDVHKSLNLQNRMPSVCSAMVSLDVFRYEIIQDTPSGASSTRMVRYYLR